MLRNQLCRHPSKGNYTLNAYDNAGLLLDNNRTYSSQNLALYPPEKDPGGMGSKGNTLTKLEAQQMIDRAMSQLTQHGDVSLGGGGHLTPLCIFFIFIFASSVKF